jgi:hypothetical protein
MDNERNDMIIEFHEPLINQGRYSSWNELHGYMSFLLQRQQKK